MVFLLLGFSIIGPGMDGFGNHLKAIKNVPKGSINIGFLVISWLQPEPKIEQGLKAVGNGGAGGF